MRPYANGKRPSMRLAAAVAIILSMAVPSSLVTSARSAQAMSRAVDSPVYGGVLTQGFKDDLATLDPAIGYDWNNWPAR